MIGRSQFELEHVPNLVTVNAQTGTVTIASNTFAPHREHGVRQHRSETVFPRVKAADVVMMPSNVVMGEGLPVECWKMSDIPEFFIERRTDAKNTISCMPVNLVGRDVGSHLITYIDRLMQLCDYTALFATLFIHADIASHLPATELHWAAQNRGVVVAALGQSGEAATLAITAMTNCIDNRGLALPLDRTDPRMIGALQTLANGVEIWHIDAAARAPIASTFVLPMIHTTLYTSQTPAAQPMGVAPTYATFLALIKTIADIYMVHGDVARGFFAASRMLNGFLSVEPYAAAVPAQDNVPASRVRAGGSRYFSCGFETNTFALPQYVPYNPIWMICGIFQPHASSPHMAHEASFLFSLTPNNLKCLSALVAAKYSLGCSAVLQHFNITGHNINSYVLGNPTKGSAVVGRLFQRGVDSTKLTSYPFASAALNFWPQVGVGSFHSYNMSGSMILSSLSTIPQLAGITCYAAPWANAVPYIVQPLSLGTVMDVMCSLFGYYGLDSRAMIRCLAHNANHAQAAGLSVAEGSKLYYDNKRKNASKYVPYGGMLINMVMQHANVAIPNLLWSTFTPAVGNTFGDALAPFHEAYQPEQEADTRTIVPGINEFCCTMNLHLLFI